MVQCIDWDVIHNCDNVHDCYTLCDARLQQCFNDSFNTVKLSRSRAKNKKWFTSSLRNCSKKKICLYKKWIKSGLAEDETEYKTYRAYFNWF